MDADIRHSARLSAWAGGSVLGLVALLACHEVQVVAVLDEDDADASESGDDVSGDSNTGWPTDLPDTEPEACGAVGLVGTPGLVLEITPDSTWENGSCLTFTVRNESDEDVFWWEIVRLGGELDSHWNAVPTAVEERTWEFRGIEDSSNVALLRGASTTFGACIACTPE